MLIVNAFRDTDVGKLVFPVPDRPGYYRIPNCATSIDLGLIGSRAHWRYHNPHTGALTYTMMNGPASTIITTHDEVTVDGVYAIILTFWPPEAENWKHRSRTWPPLAVIEEILSQPSFLVHKPSSPDPEHREEWYLSFTRAERIIARKMPSVMRMTYFFFKTIFKHVFKFKVEGREFGSYLAKTTMMWACEVLDPSVWTDANLQINLSYLFISMLYCFKQTILPHYFIPELNLLQNIPPGLHTLLEIKVDRARLITAPLTCLPDPVIMWHVCRRLCDWVWQIRAMIHTALVLRQLMKLGPPIDLPDGNVSSRTTIYLTTYAREKSISRVFNRMSASSRMDECFDWITPARLSLDTSSASDEYLKSFADADGFNKGIFILNK